MPAANRLQKAARDPNLTIDLLLSHHHARTFYFLAVTGDLQFHSCRSIQVFQPGAHMHHCMNNMDSQRNDARSGQFLSSTYKQFHLYHCHCTLFLLTFVPHLVGMAAAVVSCSE